MTNRLIVPVDGSDAAWRAVDLALSLARRWAATVEVINVLFADVDVDGATSQLAARFDQHRTQDVSASARVVVDERGVAHVIGGATDQHDGTLVVIASHGRGRSAALLGSVAEEILERISEPVLVVGPRVESGELTGPIVVTVDGSPASESVVPVAAAWAEKLGSELWVVEVLETAAVTRADVAESATPARVAQRFTEHTGRVAQFEVLRGEHVHHEIARFASSMNAALIISASRGRSGLSRFVIGSTAAAIIRRSPCPVLLVTAQHPSADAANASSDTADDAETDASAA